MCEIEQVGYLTGRSLVLQTYVGDEEPQQRDLCDEGGEDVVERGKYGCAGRRRAS